MLPAARIQAAIELLAEIIATPKPADGTVSAYFRNRRFIGSKDRAAISARIYRVMRSWHRLGWWIRRSGMEPGARALVIADLMFGREHSAQSLAAAFSGDRYAPPPLTAEERRLAQALERQELEAAEMPPREKNECPDWAFAPLRQALGARFDDEMKAMQKPAPLDLRVNILKAGREEVLERLKQDGLDAHAGRWSPWAIRVFGRPPLAQHPLFRDGVVEIQDEGSQMVAAAAAAKPGEQVADFCAGAGGKTLALGACMANKGRIVAMDVLEGRLERAKLRFRRAGLHNVETRSLAEGNEKWIKRQRGHFDLVLVDAPCTGTGTWRRDPDRRWRMLGPGLGELTALQRRILDNACRLVKPGGRLVYATCSLLPEENERQVESFVKDHPEFGIAKDFMRMTPSSHDTDGFFAAVLERKPGQAADDGRE